jgi:ankyrin repeat protein
MPTPRDRLLAGLSLVALGVLSVPAAAQAPPVAWLVLGVPGLTLALLGFGWMHDRAPEVGLARFLFLHGLSALVLLAAFAALAWLLLAWPLSALVADGGFRAALWLSASVALLLGLPWLHWAAPALLTDFASQERATPWQALADARDLCAGQDAYLAFGLPVVLALLAATTSMLLLAGLGPPLGEPMQRGTALALPLLIPLAAWLARSRTASLIETLQEEAAEDVPEPEPTMPAPEPTAVELPDPPEARLYRAARRGQVEVALSLIEEGADIHALPPPEHRDQRSLASIAATLPDLRLLRALIQRGIDLNRSIGGLTPLLAATRDSYQGRPDAVMMLLTNGADASVADAERNTPLHYAALSRDPAIAALLLDAGVAIDPLNREGLSPLGVACAAHNWDTARFLLQRGARPEPEGGVPALVAAASGAHDDATGVRLLLKHKARVNAVGPLGRSALITAALHRHAAIAEALLAAGADPALADSHGATALMEAARSGAHKVIQRLVFHKPDCAHTDQSGRTALMIACQSRQCDEETVRLLLSLGADPGQRCSDGRSPLDYAIGAGRWTLVRLLDPAYPLPASIAGLGEGREAGGEADPVELLVEALGKRRFAVAEELLGLGLPAETLADVAAQVGDVDGYRLLVAHGLPLDARLSDGRGLFEALLARRPLPWTLLAERERCGASPAGCGRLADILDSLAEAPMAAQAAEDWLIGLVDAGADPFGRGRTGAPPLHGAVRCRLQRLAAHLLVRGADPNARDRYGRSPLHHAAGGDHRRNEAMTWLLLRHGADPEQRDSAGETALGVALCRDRRDLVRWLHWPQWKPPRRRLDASDLIAAARQGDAGACRRLLDLGLPLDGTDRQGCTALLHACGAGHLPVVRLLLERGADATLSANTGATCLIAAVTTRSRAVVETLLAHGVAVSQRLPGGATALMVAANLGHSELAQLLLEHGASPADRDEAGNNALMAAAEHLFRSGRGPSDLAILDMLLDAGATPDAVNGAGQTALILLLGGCADPGAQPNETVLLDAAKRLLAAGANVDLQDQRGVSALHAAARHGLLGCVRLLTAAGANVQSRDALGRSPQEIALMRGFVDLAAELQVRGTPAR